MLTLRHLLCGFLFLSFGLAAQSAKVEPAPPTEDEFKTGIYMDVPSHLYDLPRQPVKSSANTVHSAELHFCAVCVYHKDKAGPIIGYTIDHSDVIPVIRYYTADSTFYVQQKPSTFYKYVAGEEKLDLSDPVEVVTYAACGHRCAGGH